MNTLHSVLYGPRTLDSEPTEIRTMASSCSCTELLAVLNGTSDAACEWCVCQDVRFVAPGCVQTKTDYLGGADVALYATCIVAGLVMFVLIIVEMLHLLRRSDTFCAKANSNDEAHAQSIAATNWRFILLVLLAVGATSVVLTSILTIVDLRVVDPKRGTVASETMASIMGNISAITNVVAGYTWVSLMLRAILLGEHRLHVHGKILKWLLIIGTPLALITAIPTPILFSIGGDAAALGGVFRIANAVVAVVILLIITGTLLPASINVLRWNVKRALKSDRVSLRLSAYKTIAVTVIVVSTVFLLLAMGSRIFLPPGTSTTVWGRYAIETATMVLIIVCMASSLAISSTYMMYKVGIINELPKSMSRQVSTSEEKNKSTTSNSSSLQHSSIFSTEETLEMRATTQSASEETPIGSEEYHAIPHEVCDTRALEELSVSPGVVEMSGSAGSSTVFSSSHSSSSGSSSAT